MKQNPKLEKLIEKKTQKVQRLQPHIEEVEITYKRDNCGRFLTKIKARTKKRIVSLSNANESLERSISKVFDNLNKILSKKKYKKPKRVNLSFQEAS